MVVAHVWKHLVFRLLESVSCPVCNTVVEILVNFSVTGFINEKCVQKSHLTPWHWRCSVSGTFASASAVSAALACMVMSKGHPRCELSRIPHDCSYICKTKWNSAEPKNSSFKLLLSARGLCGVKAVRLAVTVVLINVDECEPDHWKTLLKCPPCGVVWDGCIYKSPRATYRSEDL